MLREWLNELYINIHKVCIDVRTKNYVVQSVDMPNNRRIKHHVCDLNEYHRVVK